MDYVLVFPGLIYAVSPWRPRVDLSSFDYIPNSIYSVYDLSMHHLYSERTPNGVFGWREHDRELLRTLPHGSLVHLKFTTTLGPRMALLWIVRQKTAQQSQYELRMLRLKADRAQGDYRQHEINFDPRCLGPSPIRSYFLPGTWDQQLTPSDIERHRDSIRQNHDSSLPFFIYPDRDGWLTFFQDDTLVVAQEIEGQGIRRLRSGPGCSIFFQTTNTFLSAPHPTSNELIGAQTGSGWAAGDSLINLRVSLTTCPIAGGNS